VDNHQAYEQDNTHNQQYQRHLTFYSSKITLQKISSTYIIKDKLDKNEAGNKNRGKKVSNGSLVINVHAISSEQALVPVTIGGHGPRPPSSPHPTPIDLLTDLLRRHTFIVSAALFLFIAGVGLQVAGDYMGSRATKSETQQSSVSRHTIAGLNLTVPSAQYQAKLQSIASQPASITVGTNTLAISPETIKSWLLVTPSKDKSKYYFRIKSDAIQKSLSGLAGRYLRDPVNQVAITGSDGTSQVVIGGHSGIKLADPTGLDKQASMVAKTVMDGKGMQFNTPLQTMPFAALTQANFSKLIENNIATKQMYLYQNGQLVRSYAISAGKYSTPTPLGQYKIFSKLAVQDMKGFNPDGSKYLQPHVHWINYFKSGGYAIHGVYWHPLSWFGANNSSHGCVGLPDSEAQWVYNWAPIGTTVINHV
jgi:lipoprotein-anchoring transpeptidase ErfK/SrfK